MLKASWKLQLCYFQVFHDKHLLDIDDLLGPAEDITPIPSPREETPRGQSESSRMSNFFDPLGDFELGDRVSVTAPSGERTVGTLLFKGNVQFAPGVWAGVELEDPEGRHDGIEDGVRYFTCKRRHGLIVPGHDIQQYLEEEVAESIPEEVDLRASIESSSSITSEDGDLIKAISEAASNVELFEDGSPEMSPRELEDEVAPPPREPDAKAKKEKLADRITDDLLSSILQKEIQTIKSSKKQPPPVAPKPAKSRTPPTSVTENLPQTNGDIDDLEDFLHSDVSDQLPDRQERPAVPAQGAAQVAAPVNEQLVDHNTDNALNTMMHDALDTMLDIRKKRHSGTANKDLTRSQEFNEFNPEDNDQLNDDIEDLLGGGIETEDGRESGIFDDEGPAELERVLGKADGPEQMEGPPRPGSPVPGLQSNKVGGCVMVIALIIKCYQKCMYIIIQIC